MATVGVEIKVIPLRLGANRIDDAMLNGHLRRTGHALVANRHIDTRTGLATIRRHCC